MACQCLWQLTEKVVVSLSYLGVPGATKTFEVFLADGIVIFKQPPAHDVKEHVGGVMVRCQ